MSSNLESELAVWRERAGIARQYDNEKFALACDFFANLCESLLKSERSQTDFLLKARHLRKKLEASEQHRTMCVEHGLNDSAIDTTYEIQEIETSLMAMAAEEQQLQQ